MAWRGRREGRGGTGGRGPGAAPAERGGGTGQLLDRQKRSSVGGAGDWAPTVTTVGTSWNSPGSSSCSGSRARRVDSGSRGQRQRGGRLSLPTLLGTSNTTWMDSRSSGISGASVSHAARRAGRPAGVMGVHGCHRHHHHHHHALIIRIITLHWCPHRIPGWLAGCRCPRTRTTSMPALACPSAPRSSRPSKASRC